MHSPTAAVSRNAPCPCGSGKKFKQCCADRLPPGALPGSTADALAALQRGDAGRAQAIIRSLLAKSPRDPLAHYLLGHCCLQQGQADRAAESIARALELGLKDPAAPFHLGTALMSIGNFEAAAKAFRKALAGKPDFLLAQSHLAGCLMQSGRHSEAEAVLQTIVERDPRNLVAWQNLAQICYQDTRIPEAIGHYRRAAELDPRSAEIHACLATVLEVDEQLAEAREQLDQALRIDPRNATARIAEAQLLLRDKQPEEALEALSQADLERSPPLSDVAWWAGRGEALDRLGRYGEAFSAFSACKKQLARARGNSDGFKTFEAYLQREKRVLTPDWVSENALNPAETARPRPLFIVGFFRSGTTLLEQMLSRHPDVHACGELGLLPQLIDTSGLSGRIDDGAPGDLAAPLSAVRDEYLSAIRGMADPGARYATDKLPLNLFRLAWIRLLFPEARVVHMLRHPLDSVLSAFFKPFLQGNEWSLDLPSCARMFAAGWQHAQHFRTLPGLDYLALRYEDLVRDPAGELRRVLEFLELDWHDSCIDHTGAQRIARTASFRQVREAVHLRSVERFRNYLPFIDQAVLDLLAPTVEECGYSI